MKLVRTALAAALALAALPAAAAQTYSQTVFFGDSLTDSGFYRPFLVAQNPAAAILGRFTTNPGLVWAEYIADFYGTNATPAWGLTPTGVVNLTGTDFAAGGARVASNPGFPPTPPTSFAPSLAQQVGSYLGRNGGKADPNALFTVWGGANDLFFTLQGLTTQTQFLTAATQEVGLVSTLHNAGAQYILVPTLPDVGQTPFGLSQGAAGSAGITALVNGYNQTLFGGLAQAGLHVIPLNTFALLHEVSATPSAFGFTNVTSPACGATPALVCAPGNYPPGAPDSYAFADGVHPSSASHKILADYAISMLEGPRLIAVLPHSEEVVGRSRAERVDAQAQARLSSDGDGMRWWTDARGDFQRYGDGNLYDGAGPALTGGVDWRSGNLVYGGFLGYGRSNLDFGHNAGKFDQRDASIGGYAGWRMGAGWVDGQLSYTKLNYGIDRDVHLGISTRRHHGSTDGTNFTAGVEGGWDFGSGAVKHGPVLGVLSQRIDVNGFAEDQAALSTALAYPDRKFDSLIGKIGWQARFEAGPATPYARVTLDREFKDAPEQAFARSQTLGATGDYAVPGVAFDDSYVTAQLGVRAAMFGLKTDIGASLTGGQKNGNDASVYLTVGGDF